MIKSLDELTSARMVYKAGDLFNPPALTNFCGSLQAATCVSAVQHLTFPPFSHGDMWIGALTVNNTCIGTSGLPITYVWRPDQILRFVELGTLKVESTTTMMVGKKSVVVRIQVSNSGKDIESVKMRVRTGFGVIQSTDGWHTPYSPKEGPSISVTPWEGTPPRESLVSNKRAILASSDGVVYTSRTSNAASLQGTVPKPSGIDGSWLDFDFDLGAGEEQQVYFYIGIGGSDADLIDEFERLKLDPAKPFRDASSDWLKELKAVFDPGNDRYSGHLPTLKTTNQDLRKVYLNAILGVVYHKRFLADGPSDRTYVTLMPRYWVTTSFINDWSMSAYLLAMLDPDCLKRQIELWLRRDIYSHFGTEYVSGACSGNWYSCNDFAMIRLISAYVRVTGDQVWLTTTVGGKTIIDYCRSFATHYRSLDGGNGLADYGDRNSLLEAVGSYTNEVASLNAANVWNLRELDELERCVQPTVPKQCNNSQADALLRAINRLYVQGSGFWNVRTSEGKLVPVRHAWDLVHLLNFVPNDLDQEKVAEMLEFFCDELLSPSWMAALSGLDEDVTFSLRPDHQWNGSWPGWVALAACALVIHGREDLLAQWLPGLARSANQGPYSQSHFVEHYASPIDGGARKAPTDWPYINDWATVCVGGFFELVILQLFGLEFGYEKLTARPRLSAVDLGACLENVQYKGASYSVSIDGVHSRTGASSTPSQN